MNDAQRTPTADLDLERVREFWVKNWPNDDRTHWEDCWKVHHECMTARLCAEVETLTKRLASSYDNEIALADENERLRHALDAVDEIVKLGNWQPASFVRERIAKAVSSGRS